MSGTITQAILDEVFPAERTDMFFDALFGGAEDGAYDIRLVPVSESPSHLSLAFELRQRPGKCLACNLTYGLPQVFQRHPVLDVAGTVTQLAGRMGWDSQKVKWTLGRTQEKSREVHHIPLEIQCS